MTEFSNPTTLSKEKVQSSQNYTQPFITITFLFFMWGFITVMNDLLINTFEEIFDLHPIQSSLVQSAFFGAFFIISLIYFVISSAKGDPINRIGYNNGMAISLIVCGIGCILFYPAALLHSYWFFLFSLFILASGVTFLQICANPYATLLGKPETASGRLNLAQGLNSLGTTLGPLVGVTLIFRIFSDGKATPNSIGLTYLIYGVIFMLLAVLVKLVKLPQFTNHEKIEKGLQVFRFRHLNLGIFAIFFYVGAEVTIGSFLVKLFQQPAIMGLPQESANYFLAYYWGGAMIGRVLGAISLSNMRSSVQKHVWMLLSSLGLFLFIYFITSLKDKGGVFYFDFLSFNQVSLFLLFLSLNFIAFLIGKSSPQKSLTIFSMFVILLLCLVSFTGGEIAFWSAISIGLFNSIMWSNIFSLAIKDLGKYTSQGSSLLVMAIVGGAVYPPLQAILVGSIGIQLSFLAPIVSYIYLFYYGVEGYKTKSESRE